MKINKISMAIIAAASLMTAGPMAYAQSTNNAGGGTTAPARPRGGGALTIDAIDKAVTLTDAEKPKVQSALDDLNKGMQDARAADQSERRSKMQTARQSFDTAMKGILTPDQYTKFAAMPRGGGGRRAAGGAGGGAGGGNPPPANNN